MSEWHLISFVNVLYPQMTVVKEWHGGALKETEARQGINPTIKDVSMTDGQGCKHDR